jgi:hypothetical protein
MRASRVRARPRERDDLPPSAGIAPQPELTRHSLAR